MDHDVELTTLSTDELLALAQARSNQVAEIKEAIRAINRILNARAAQAKAEATVAAMSDTERAALAQVLHPASIESAEKVNG